MVIAHLGGKPMAPLTDPFDPVEVSDAISIASDAYLDLILDINDKGQAATADDLRNRAFYKSQIDMLTGIQRNAVAEALNAIFAEDNAAAQNLRAVIKAMECKAHAIYQTAQTVKAFLDIASALIEILTAAIKAPSTVAGVVLDTWNKYAAPSAGGGSSQQKSP